MQYIPRIYDIADGNVEVVEVSRLIDTYEAPLQRAFKIMKQNNPVFYQLVRYTIKNVSLFKSPDLNSFASMMMHGAIFLNVGIVPIISKVLFIEDIAHQAAHVIFNVMIIDTEDFLVVDKNTKVSDSNNSGRTVYVVYHALFTYCCILDCLDQYLEKKSFKNEEDEQEALARIGFLLRKMKLDIATATKDNYYTELGKTLLSNMISSFDEMLNKYQNKVSSFNYSGQPYNFDIKQFREINIK